jgi:predicted ATPase/DNA-binding CsgD family transcriptional regulator
MNGTPSEPTLRGRLPEPPSALVGRTRELAELVDLLNSGARLITLTGTGGAGKTRLALEAGRRVESRFPGGGAFVSLASLQYPSLVTGAVASALDIREPAAGSTETSVIDRLSGTATLLILDNFEHLLDATSLVELLLDRCPALQLLITSRVDLRLPDETVYPTEPLTIPDLANLPDMECLATIGSVELFVARATESYHRFVLTEQHAPAVAAICARLGGLPLAIELAAARCRHASPQSLLRQLDITLPLLTGGPEDVPERQRTMRDTIAWSYALLDDPQKRLFERVAVHAGGFDLDAARAVAQARPAIEIDVFDGISELLDHCLITRNDLADGSTRYGMLEPVREYALEKLEASGDLASVRIAHARHFLDRAHALQRHIRGPRGAATLIWFDTEHANLRGAIGNLIRARRGWLARSLVLAMWQFWWIRGQLMEGRRWLDAALELFDPENPDELEPELRYAAALFALSRGNVRGARRHATTGVTLAKQLGDEFWHAALLTILAHAAAQDGDFPRAISLYKLFLKSIRPFRDTHPFASHLEAATHLAASTAYMAAGEPVEAEYHANEALRIWLRRGDKWGIGLAKLNLATIAAAQGDHVQALELYHDSVPLLWEIGDQGSVAQGLLGLADITASLGLIETAASLLGAADALGAAGAPSSAQVIAGDRNAILAKLQALTSEEIINRGMSAGRERARQDLIALVEEAIAAIAARLLPSKRGSGKSGAASLSRREREVLCLMVEGMTDQQIADTLFIGYRTVTTHTGNIYGKLDVNNRSAAVTYAIRHELC